jgi:hypothetical protein
MVVNIVEISSNHVQFLRFSISQMDVVPRQSYISGKFIQMLDNKIQRFSASHSLSYESAYLNQAWWILIRHGVS